MERPSVDYYRNRLVRDSEALKQLANDERCQIFHTSVTHRMPLIVIEGAWPLVEVGADDVRHKERVDGWGRGA